MNNTWLGQEGVGLSQVTVNYVHGFMKPKLPIDDAG